jgi:hypothetical protein
MKRTLKRESKELEIVESKSDCDQLWELHKMAGGVLSSAGGASKTPLQERTHLSSASPAPVGPPPEDGHRILCTPPSLAPLGGRVRGAQRPAAAPGR